MENPKECNGDTKLPWVGWILLKVYQFIKQFSKIALPLTNLTKKGARYEWKDSCEESFQELKDQLTSTPVLRLVAPDERFMVYCDPLGKDWGVC